MTQETQEILVNLSATLEGKGNALLPLPAALLSDYQHTSLSAEVQAALRDIVHLPLNTAPEEAVATFDKALAALAGNGFSIVDGTGRAEKFDIFDEYFHINRTDEDPGRAYLYGLLASFRNMYATLDPEGSLTVTEIPLLRIALESALEMFEF